MVVKMTITHGLTILKIIQERTHRSKDSSPIRTKPINFTDGSCGSFITPPALDKNV